MAERPIVILNDTSVDRHHGCSRVMRTMRSLAAARGLEVIGAAPAHRDWRRNTTFLRALDRARLVLVNGEGTIHHNRPAGHVLLEAGRAAQERGIPAALINMSWQANNPDFSAMLRNFEIVSVRESASEQEIVQIGIFARRVPDLSLYRTYSPTRHRVGVGFTDSVLLQVAEHLRILRSIHAGQGVSIFDLTRVPLDRARLLRSAVSSAQDRSLPGRVRSVTRAWREAEFMSSTEEALLRRIAGLSLLVTGRFHAMCFALVTCTPFVAVETNTHKIDGLIADSGLGRWRNTSVSEVDPALLERARVWDPSESEALDDFLADSRRRTDELFDDLYRLAR